MSVTLYSTARPRHRHDQDPSTFETRELTATGEDYEEAKAGLFAQLPDGWLLLAISTYPRD